MAVLELARAKGDARWMVQRFSRHWEASFAVADENALLIAEWRASNEQVLESLAQLAEELG